ncbi:glycoside hydrolase family 13 protein [Vagococcus xieshaowenii]|uniref:Alpha-glucosidase n=1 Tax=Vagococcus xieshaowenii TaxID=2562451 RepID=A0AAJ5EF04_9ENTE|nr:alpha-glucosidase [Vagococcus xieshaowenii]QCA28117.1 alpha-glucosidase [Vagococcus xieshaowenii]TFZ40160.1 alpha-glucosidase [Vagococcus xieshaowenii]
MNNLLIEKNNQTDDWWKKAVAYQIYPRSFYDSNNDGIGDLNGIREKLPYLKELGIDFIWLNPIYASPNVDNGYDISDYQAIHPDFGTMAEFEQLLAEAHALDIKIIMDLVVNHTSDQHPWFLEARQSKDNPYRDYYLWEDATADQLPNNWQSFFGGPTWTYDETTEQAYFHVFAKEQPDLNWKNPTMRAAIYKMIRWWLNLGIDGFRIDAISHIQKEPWDFEITDNQWAPFMNVSGIDDYMLELKAIFDEYDIVTVGEASGVSSEEAVAWTGNDGYVNMIFELEHCGRIGEPGQQKGSIPHLKDTLTRWQNSLADNGWNALYLENHDTPRSVSVYGDGSEKSAKALATLLLLMKGTPFIYQGQELGMINYPFRSIEEVDGKDTLYAYQALLEEQPELTSEEALTITMNWSRDHSRTPFQWNTEAFGGFSKTTPWLAVNPNFPIINAQYELQQPHSVVNFYKQLITLRKNTDTLIHGTYHLLLKNHPSIYAFTRQSDTETWLIITNLSTRSVTIDLSEELTLNDWQLILTNNQKLSLSHPLTLERFDALVYRKRH